MLLSVSAEIFPAETVLLLLTAHAVSTTDLLLLRRLADQEVNFSITLANVLQDSS